MSTHQVTLNGKPIAVARDRYKLLTMVLSIDNHDADGNTVATHELVVEGVDAFGPATEFIPRMPLKKGDVVQILIGDRT